MKEDSRKRRALVEQTTNEPCPLNYNYFHGELSKKDAAFHANFLAESLSKTASRKHMESFLKDLERVRVELAAKEAAALPKWKKATAEEVAMRSGSVYEIPINSRNLGVILDNSPSMSPYLEKVRAEINRDFSGSYMVEVNGCEMWYSSGAYPWFYAETRDTINPFSPERRCPAIPQIESKSDLAKQKTEPKDPPYQFFWNCQHDAASAPLGMVQLMKVDAIYWFTDFDDPMSEAILKKIAPDILDSKVKIYTHSMKSSPPPLLRLLIENQAARPSKSPCADLSGR